MTPVYDWKTFLIGWNRQLLDGFDRADYEPEIFAQFGVPPANLQARWLGFPGADEATIAALETRLVATLPPSYRAFLMESDGFCQPDDLVPRIYPCAEVDWFRNTNPEETSEKLLEWSRQQFGTVEIPDEDYFVYDDGQAEFNMRDEYIPFLLRISEREISGSAMYLLNPKVVTDEGEWESWMMAHWLPGARRYRSFWDMMQAEAKSFSRR